MMLAVGCIGLLRVDRRDNQHREQRTRNEGAKHFHRVILLVIGPVQHGSILPLVGQRKCKAVAKQPLSLTGDIERVEGASTSSPVWCSATPLRRSRPSFRAAFAWAA